MVTNLEPKCVCFYRKSTVMYEYASSLHLSLPAVLFYMLKIFFHSFNLILEDTEAFLRGHLISLAFLKTKAQHEHLSRKIKLLDASQRREMPWYRLYRLQTLYKFIAAVTKIIATIPVTKTLCEEEQDRVTYCCGALCVSGEQGYVWN